PRIYKESSFALGATRFQTTMRIIVPSAVSGIISAVLLGIGRVIGETMVVLLCAGNRIRIPDFTQGMGVPFEPVHTMTGIIAQEMGEVAQGGVHYRALFCVGIVLFLLTLVINMVAQKIFRHTRVGE
ncbi:MAG: ABC transporter permease subunit, partial [Verrucomicrobiota bacterium]